MALIVETGVGILDADSFASVAEADAFWTNRGPSGTQWLALSNGAKEVALRDATDYVALKLGSRAPLGSLAWPWDGYTVTAFDLSRVKRATILVADITRLGPLIGGAAQGGRVVSESKTLGPLSKSATYSDRPLPPSANGRDLTFVDQLLSGMTATGGLVVGTTGRA